MGGHRRCCGVRPSGAFQRGDHISRHGVLGPAVHRRRGGLDFAEGLQSRGFAGCLDPGAQQRAEQRLPEWEVQRARALALSDQAIDELNPRLMGQVVSALEAVLARDPDDVAVLRSLGFLYGSMQSHEKAIRLFAAALQVAPHDELSLKNLGLMAYRTGSLDLGRRSYEAFLKLNPWDVTIYGPYGSLLAASGDLQGAVHTAEQGLRLDPTERELRRVAVHLYARLGDQQKSRQHAEILQQVRARLDPWDQKREDRLREKMQQNLQPAR